MMKKGSTASASAAAESTTSSSQLRIDVPPPASGGVATTTVSATTTNIIPSDDRKSPSTTAQDSHPYSRGSVIEVWHIPKKDKKKNGEDEDDDDDDDWWSGESSSSSDEEEEDENAAAENTNNDGQNATSTTNDPNAASNNNNISPTNNNNVNNSKKQKKKKLTNGRKTIRLCDIIDRVQQHGGGTSWRYYVHYRDFNRRMDEWIPVSRIVSPPSIGNAKARALKREEERNRKRKLIQQQQQEAAAAAAAAQAATRAGVRRRSTAAATTVVASTTTTTIGSSLSTASSAQVGPTSTTMTVLSGDASGTTITEQPGGGSGRRTRVSRRKSTVYDDDADDDPLNLSMTSTGSSHPGTPRAGNITPTTGSGATTMDMVGENTSTAAVLPPVSTTMTTTTAVSGAAHHPKTKSAGVVTTTVGEHTVATVQAVELDEHEGMDEASLREHEEVTKIKNVGFLELGQYQMETWYYSPLPKELIHGNKETIPLLPPTTPNGTTSNTSASASTGFLEVLYVCEFTLRMFARKCELQRFQRTIQPQDRHPPGNEIYRHDNLAMFEIDGLEEKVYCQNLCYIAKLFLDHKTLYFDVDPFLFYVLCEVDNRGFHPVGYYSKEKYSDVGYNLACILSFPAHQRKGYGRFLIAFSYELTKKEEKVGSPEKPMSDLGQQAYKPYWASTIIDFLLNQSDESALSIMDISKRTSIMSEDIVYTLNQLGILKIINGVYFIAAERGLLSALAKKYPIKEPRVNPLKLHWTPFLTDIKRDKFSIHSKKSSVEAEGVTNSSFTTHDNMDVSDRGEPGSHGSSNHRNT